MKHYSQRDYILLGGLLVVGGGIGWLFGAAGWGFALALSGWVLLQHLEYVALRKWAERPLARPKFRTDAWHAAADTLYRSARRQRSRTNQALLQLRQMRAVTEALPDAAVMVDRYGRIESFNPAATDAFGVTTRDTGLRLTELVRHPALINLMRDSDSTEPVEFASPKLEGVRLEVRKIAVSDERTLVLGRNVTQLNRLLSMRQDFVANVSHELRTPLTVILGYLETLRDESLSPEELQALVHKLVPPSQRMQALVDDLLLLTRLESSPGVSDDELDTIDIQALFHRVIGLLEGLAHPRHDIRVDISSASALRGLPNEIESAVTNLLSNAIRYSPDGGEITLSWEATPDGAVLSVRDHGMGIGGEHLDRLTERFYRVDLARSRFQGGTGLGLAIVKHVLKRHHSALCIDSELGKGSRFYCQFSHDQLITPGDIDPIAVGSQTH